MNTFWQAFIFSIIAIHMPTWQLLIDYHLWCNFQYDSNQFLKKYDNLLFQLFCIIVFGCISAQGWVYDEKTDKEKCLYNNDGNACNYGVGIGVIGFLASMAFIVGEYLFEQMSSVKTRKHYVLADLAFSGESHISFDISKITYV